MTQNITKKHVTIFDLRRANRKKYLKYDGKTFILPHKREYALLLVFACSGNC